MSGILSSSISSSCCSSVPSAFCHAPMHVYHPLPASLRQFTPVKSPSRAGYDTHDKRRDLQTIINLKSCDHPNSNRWRRTSTNVVLSMSRRPDEDFGGNDEDNNQNQEMDNDDSKKKTGPESSSKQDGMYERYIYDLEEEETLLELLALDDLDELDGDDLDLINLNDLEELKELEQMLNQHRWDDDHKDEDGIDIDIGLEDDDEIDADVDFDDSEDTEEEEDEKDKISILDSIVKKRMQSESDMVNDATTERSIPPSSSALEQALMQGVVPAAAGVGSNCLPGDYGFDPLGLATKDYFKKVQNFILNLLPAREDGNKHKTENTTPDPGAALPRMTTDTIYYDNGQRPPALILRDYREIEIRHGRLAMLAALLWPLQEIIDRLFIPELFGKTTIIYGGVTLPFVTLFMTLVMLLLGYLDIYAASIKENDAGDAFLPGECFWDPLRILDGTSESVKRNMQARELNNGRFAMVAVLSYILQESITHQPLITLPWNQVLFEPAFEIPAVQAWLDGQFAGAITGKGVVLIEQERVLEGGEVLKVIIVEDGSSSANSISAAATNSASNDLGDIVENISGKESGIDGATDGVKAVIDAVTD